MCRLNALFCVLLEKAQMPDGTVIDLLNGAGNHHDFVYGTANVFPKRSMDYLVEKGVTTAEEYRTLAVSERIQSIHNSSSSMFGGPYADYVAGRTHTVRRDEYVSEVMWKTTIVPRLKLQRAERLRHDLWSHGEHPGRLAELQRGDAYPDIADLVQLVAMEPLYAYTGDKTGEAFMRGGTEQLEIGTGAISSAFATYLVKRRVRGLQQRLEHEQGPGPDGDILATLFPDLWRSYSSAVEVHLGKSYSKSKSRKRDWKFHVAPRLLDLARAISANQKEVIRAVMHRMVRIVVPTKGEEAFQAAA